MPGDILFQPLMFRNLTVKNRIFRLDPPVSEHHPRDETLDGLLTISRPVFAYPVEDLSDRAVRTGRREMPRRCRAIPQIGVSQLIAPRWIDE